MDADAKLTTLIILWIVDKLIVFAMIHWEMRKKK